MTRRGVQRAVAAAIAGLLICTNSGCFHVIIEAPPFPEHVRLLPADAPVEVRRENQANYYAWGLFR